MNKINKHQKAITLIEMIASIFIFIVGISGAIVVLNNIVGNFRLATDVFIANNLAAEGVELVRNMRDRNSLAGIVWPHGLAVGNHQVDFNDTVLTAHVHGRLYRDVHNFFQHDVTAISTPFRRRIEIANCLDAAGVVIADCLKIRSIVTWISFVREERLIIATKLFRY